MAAFLSTLSALHDAQIFRDQARKYGFQLRTLPRGCDENVGDSFQAIHPIIRTNPVTGRRGLFVNKEFTNRIVELNVDESDAMLAYLFRLQHESHSSSLLSWLTLTLPLRHSNESKFADTHVRYRWSKNDVAIWDNRSTAHGQSSLAELLSSCAALIQMCERLNSQLLHSITMSFVVEIE